MNVYKAFSKRPSFDNYDDDWRSFSSVFPYLVENDDNLKLLIDEFDFLNNNWSEIWENVGLQLEEELLWLRYLDSDIPDEKTLIKRICDIAENVLKGGLLNLIENKAASLHLPKEYDFPEDYEILFPLVHLSL